MHADNKISNYKTRVISKIMNNVKGFNEKHRALAGVTTFFTIIFIAILSALLIVAEKICCVFGNTGEFGKRALGVVLGVLLLCLALVAGKMMIPAREATGPAEEPEAIGVVEATELEAAEAVAQEPEAQETAVAEEEPAAEVKVRTKDWDISDVDLAGMMADYGETVGWIYFEDGHISYPIMQYTDNKKYKEKGFNGQDAPTGAIFLDCRSAADFSDYNSIIYGHNMKDRTMFGSLRDYREDPTYYNDHQYFQVITPEKTYRYQIFEYMDVAETYVLYDYVGDAAYEFVKDAEPVRIKSYMDSEIPVNTSTKVVTLSTCTDKDQLQFVVLGVMVDETE